MSRLWGRWPQSKTSPAARHLSHRPRDKGKESLQVVARNDTETRRDPASGKGSPQDTTVTCLGVSFIRAARAEPAPA